MVPEDTATEGMITMKAFIPTGDPSEPVVLADVAEPTPRPDEVLVKVEAFSVNRGETFKLEKPASGDRPDQVASSRKPWRRAISAASVYWSARSSGRCASEPTSQSRCFR